MEIPWSTRTTKALIEEGCRTIYDIASRTEQEWLRVPNIGRKSVNEMREVLATFGLNFGSAR